MCTLMRRTGIGALILCGLLAGHNAAQAQFGSSPFTPPAMSNPYAPLGGASGIAPDPYMPNPYMAGSLYSPYAGSSVGPGLTLMGGADMLRASGDLLVKQEKARIMRSEYYQKQIETRRLEFDLDRYMKENTPTWNQRQEKIMKSVLRRIQTSSNAAEIVEGRSLNLLLDDVDKNYTFNKSTVPEIALDADILKHLNVRPAGLNNNSLGMLRDASKLQWPAALVKMLPADVRHDMEAKAQALAKNTADGKAPDLNAAADFQGQIGKAREQLLKKANDFDTTPYMDAKRFLNDLDNSRMAIERGHGRAQVEYQALVNKSEIKNINQLASTMVKNGWRFAPALLADEAAYRALHSALVAYDVALNQQIATSEGN